MKKTSQFYCNSVRKCRNNRTNVAYICCNQITESSLVQQVKIIVFITADNHIKLIVGSAVAVGTITAAGLAYLYWQKNDEPIPEK